MSATPEENDTQEGCSDALTNFNHMVLWNKAWWLGPKCPLSAIFLHDVTGLWIIWGLSSFDRDIGNRLSIKWWLIFLNYCLRKERRWFRWFYIPIRFWFLIYKVVRFAFLFYSWINMPGSWVRCCCSCNLKMKKLLIISHLLT